MRKPIVLLAEDHEVVGIGLRHVLEDDFEVYGPHADGSTLVQVLGEVRPDILVLDLSLKGRNGMFLMDDVLRRDPRIRIVIYTTYADFDLMEEARRRGASGYVGKDAGVAELQRALAAVRDGETWFSNLIRRPRRRALGSGPHASAIAKLTNRRQELLALIGEGRTTGEIAVQLDMSERTVYWHRSMIRKALGVEGDEDLARIAAVWYQAARRAETSAPMSKGRRRNP